jgi:hypothetical protein
MVDDLPILLVMVQDIGSPSPEGHTDVGALWFYNSGSLKPRNRKIDIS